VEKKLSELVERFKNALGQRLASIILYGSGAAGDWSEGRSDLNVLCVLEPVTPDELRLAEPILRWWRAAGNPAPLLLTPEEVQTSTDCFPMEFHDMQQHRRVLHGRDVIEGLVVDNKFYRAQVEQEMRSKQLRLRQRAAEVLSQPDRLSRLMADSVSTFCVLGRHALVLAGESPYWNKKELLAALEKRIESRLPAFDEILTLRADPKHASHSDTVPLLARYLTEVAALVHFIDRL
jgi:predicted nucleotidyltransferase